MRQYFEARDEHPGVLLLMRVGDFYEAYGDDAVAVAELLNITLTGRDDSGQRVAMAGVPHHAVERYLARLLKLGRRVALMEQQGEQPTGKGLFTRKVTRVLSRGTVLEDGLLESDAANRLVAVASRDGLVGVAALDVSTGEFLTTQFDRSDALKRGAAEVARLDPSEVLIEEGDCIHSAVLDLLDARRITPMPASGSLSDAAATSVLLEHFGTLSLRGYGCDGLPAAARACALALTYVKGSCASALKHIVSLGAYSVGSTMQLDAATRRNLEITQSLSEGGRQGSLLSVLDRTVTPMGARMLRGWLLEPLLEADLIRERHDAVAELAGDPMILEELRSSLRGVQDIERLVSRASAGVANARDLGALASSLFRTEALRSSLVRTQSPILARCAERLNGDGTEISLRSIGDEETLVHPSETQAELRARLTGALQDNPPVSLRDGGLIRAGHSEELDELRRLAAGGRGWIAAFEATARASLNIPSLKVGFNSVFGYYIEVTRTHLDKVPAEYIRKQTTANAERYITQELKEYETRVTGADERAADLEHHLFCALRERVAAAAPQLLATARAAATVDVLAGLAAVATSNRYVRPVVDDGLTLQIRAGRHPVVEALRGVGRFVPNDCLLDSDLYQVHILTGPNMSGKSTALRQVALIALMAQSGSFVPADAAHIGVVDRIFTRVGAHDELASGQSTFMVEMNETANILNNATERSLVILDEVGRGTSTFDGLAIAWAVVERLVALGCKSLFATHYHQLNEIAASCASVKNFRVAVRETESEVIWLHRVVAGGTDKSYGLQVARMAGVPQPVVARAKAILENLERGSGRARPSPPAEKRLQLTLFDLEPHPVVEALRQVDVSVMTPVEALIRLEELVRLAGSGQ